MSASHFEREALQHLAVGVFVTGPEGALVLANPAAAPLLAEGVRWMDEGRAPVPASRLPWLECHRSGRPVAGRTLGVVVGGAATRWLSVSSVPGKSSLVTTTLLDVTEVERMKGDLIANVSHELRTPLTSVVGALGLLASGAAEPLGPRALALVDIARKNGERLVRLVNDVLDVERLGAGQMSFRMGPLDIAEALVSAVAANRDYARSYEVELDVVEAPIDVMVRADADRIAQVITNLVANAVHYSPAGGRVQLRAVEVEHAVRVEVSDSGPGVPAEFADRVFARFAQADASDSRAKGGTGLGLSISRAIVEAHGGRIGFFNRAEGGACFWFEVPFRTPPK